MRLLDVIVTDLRYARRSARRAPGFFVVAILILAVGIGMSTAIVTVLHTVALRGLPVASQEELVVLHAEDLSRGFDHVPLTHAMFEEFARSTNTLSSVGGLQYAGAWPRDFLDGERHVRATGVVVTGDFFETLGAPVAMGRPLQSTDYAPAAEPSMVISHRLWQREFAGDPQVIGRRLRLVFSDDMDLTVVGVMPEGFRVPGDVDYWLPLDRLYGSDLTALAGVGIDVIGRLESGASAQSARDEYEGYLRTQTLSTSYAIAGLNGVALPLLEAEVGDVRPILLIVSAAVALLLLIACFNIAILLLMRSTRRGHELRVRNALGASGRRIAAQLLTESVVIAGAGGVLGFLSVGPILRLFVRFAPEGLPRLQDLSISGATLTIGIVTTALAAVLAGVLPALSAVGTGRGALGSGSIRSTETRRSMLTRRILVSTQFGLALVVLAAAGLVVKSLDRLQSLETGFEPEDVVYVELAGPLDKIGPLEETRAFFERLLPDLESRSGIEHATALFTGPFSGAGGYDGRYVAEGQTSGEAEGNPWLNFEIVSPGYFDVLDVAAVSGRLLTEGDREGAPLSVVVSELTAAALWPGEPAVGRRVRTARAGADWYEVVGVVSDTRYREYRDPRPSIYFTTGQSPYPFHPTQLAVRTSGATGAAVSTIRQVVAETEPEILVAVVSTMTDLMREPLAQPRLNVLLLMVFATTALGLAAVGLYGILSFAVRQRRRELGIRQALGASSSDIARVVLREGMIIALGGAAFGLVLSLALGQTLRAMLFDVSPADPATLVAAIGFLTVVALGACALPARQAASSDPNELLRSE